MGGTTSAGTEGAFDFVMNEQAFGAFLKKPASGNRIPHFDALLRTGNVAANAQQTELLGYRIHKR